MYYQADEKPVRPLTAEEQEMVNARKEAARKDYFRKHEAQVRAQAQAGWEAREQARLEKLVNKFAPKHEPRVTAEKAERKSWDDHKTGTVAWNDEDNKLKANKPNAQPEGPWSSGWKATKK